MLIIKSNKVRCKLCGDIIESKYTYDFKWCKCNNVAVDGGTEYLRRCGNRGDMEELSEYERVDEIFNNEI
jgi:hypothetical protein